MNVRGFLRTFLGWRDWVYLLSLLVPFVVYNLSLKANDVAQQPGDHGLFRDLNLMRSDLFFDLGYVLLWVGLFAALRRGPLRWAVVFLFHVVTMLVVVVTTCAHQYFQENGTTLDYGTIAEWIPKFEELGPIFANDVPLAAWAILAAALFYAILGPLLVTWAVSRLVRPKGRHRERSSPIVARAKVRLLGSVGLWVLALGCGFLSLLIESGPAGASKSFARDPFVNVVWTGVQEATTKDNSSSALTAENPAAHASLVWTPWTDKQNVVLVHLESTRARSVTPYNEDLKTTPFLDELSKSSLLAERNHVTVPRSSKASVAVNCGIEPPLYPGPEFEPGGIPAPCLASLLKDQNYKTVFFASTENSMDNFGDVASGFGYQEVYSAETMDRENFPVTNTFGFEDDIMLDPSKEWLEKNDNQPFLAEYLTGTGHYGYECLDTDYGNENFDEDEQVNRYDNCMRLQDHFVENLINQYKELGLYDNTIFVVFGDHGEGFGEHGRYLHGDTIYEEGLQAPLLIHAPGRFENGERVSGLTNQIDIVPTVLELLGYGVKGGEYPGYSLLHQIPEDRTLKSSCITNRKCLASIKGNEKYVYHYGDQPDEVFDLSKDPLEQNSIADQYGQEELDRRRQDLLSWFSGVNAGYSKGAVR